MIMVVVVMVMIVMMVVLVMVMMMVVVLLVIIMVMVVGNVGLLRPLPSCLARCGTILARFWHNPGVIRGPLVAVPAALAHAPIRT